MLAHIPTVTTFAGLDPLTTAVAVLAGGLGALVLGLVLADRRGLLPGPQVPFRRWIAIVVGGLSLGAGSIHLAVIDAHLAEYPPYGIAFAALAGFQVVWAVGYFLTRDRSVAMAAIVVNAGALLVWAASRTVGLPFGPEPGRAEPVGPLDIAAGIMETALIVVLAWDLGAIGRRLRPALPRAGAALVAGSSALAVVLLTTTAFVAAGADPHGGMADDLEQPAGVGSTSSPTSSPPGTAPPLDLAIIDPGIETQTGSASAPTASAVAESSALATEASSAAAPKTIEPAAPATPSPAPDSTARPATPAPATPKPTSPPPATVPEPGQIIFGRSVDADGDIVAPIHQFGEGQSVAWVAAFTDAPQVAIVRFFIVQILPDGREFEHWREDVTVADPAARRLVGSATLSVYLHGGEGSYRLRYLRGDTLLAEGAFEFVP